MSKTNCAAIPEPACPVCGSPTVLKQQHRNTKAGGDTCVFKCTVCGVEYPIVVPAHPPRLPRTEA